MGKIIDLTNQRIGRLVIESYSHTKRKNGKYWNCLCDCGNRSKVLTSNLTKKNPTQSCGCLTIENLKLVNKNRIPWNKGKPRSDLIGEKSPNWKGGKYLSHDGYQMIKVEERFNAKTPWSCYRKEHIDVIEKHLKRNLVKGEIVHHIDKNKLNNDISNLYLTNQSNHRAGHNSLEILSIELYKIGYVVFNRDTGLYEFSEKFKEVMKNNESN
jgi:HNH endonuclease